MSRSNHRISFKNIVKDKENTAMIISYVSSLHFLLLVYSGKLIYKIKSLKFQINDVVTLPRKLFLHFKWAKGIIIFIIL